MTTLPQLFRNLFFWTTLPRNCQLMFLTDITTVPRNERFDSCPTKVGIVEKRKVPRKVPLPGVGFFSPCTSFRVAVRRAGVRVDGERVASGSHRARASPSPSGGARAGDGARAGNGFVVVDGGRGVGWGDRPNAAEGSVDGEALARGACSVPPNLRDVNPHTSDTTSLVVRL